jgi:lipopolysaccharide/colanic/teichoic acid biosynthesis glycosyltransferase
MATQGERQNYMWRPNTNDSKTLARYDQEAQHWVRAFRNAESQNKKASLNEVLRFFGIVFTLISSIMTVLVLLVVNLLKRLKK